jgi:hypothetical protein
VKRATEVSFLEAFATIAGVVCVVLVLLGRGSISSAAALAVVGLMCLSGAIVALLDWLAGPRPPTIELMRHQGPEVQRERWAERYSQRSLEDRLGQFAPRCTCPRCSPSQESQP